VALRAERGDEAIREIASERCLETIESGRLGDRFFLGDRADDSEETRRTGRGDLREDGGTHVSDIGSSALRADPWREGTARLRDGSELESPPAEVR